MSAAPLGEPTLKPAGLQLVGATPLTPAPIRHHCPNRDRPAWLPPRQFHCSQDHYLQGTYGITCDDYWWLFEHQDGRCAICRRPPAPGRRLVVDHDHDTGAIDGLCHFGCNRRLPAGLRRYLADPPGRAAGLRVARAKLRVIQARDDAKRKRDRDRREQREADKARPAAPSQLNKMRTMTRER